MAKGFVLDLTGKVTVVTGGNSGLGLGFARGIAKAGGDLEIWARSAEKNAAAKAELESHGVRVTTRQVDVASEQEVIAAYEALMQDFGRVDCVIANSGLGPTSRSTLEMTTEQWHQLLNVNLHGAFYTLREGARQMVRRAEAGEPGGSLIFCGSLSMFHGLAGKGNYAAAKGAMGAVIRSMAVEFGKYGIRANTVAPGYIKTGLTGEDKEWGPIDKFFAAKTPIPRPGYPSDFEAIIAYLASDFSSFHTGDTIVIDGGSLVAPPYYTG
ncbi:MAG TPA: SDR family oxidoreductase [Acetobacteraceae bacterium]|nr:SDR family oxidoreductase [Acetobacteraceae bacterium]